MKTRLSSQVLPLLLLCLIIVPALKADIPMQRLLSRATVTPDNNWFGSSVALSPSYRIVGEARSDDIGASGGTAQVFSGTTGTFLRRLKPVGLVDRYFWVASVAVSGSRALVGDTAVGEGSGAVYVFDVTTGRQLHRLIAADGSTSDLFGASVALHGNLALVGAPGDNTGVAGATGSAYLFDINTGLQLAKLVPSDGTTGMRFGASVTLNGSYAIVGAAAVSAGAVYVFDALGHAELKKLSASDGAVGDEFGRSVSVAGNVVLVGAPKDETNRGSAYLFFVPLGLELRKLEPFTPAGGGLFGSSVSLSQDLALIGTPGTSAAFWFNSRTGEPLDRVDGPSGSNFGNATTLSGNEMLVGAHTDDSLATDAGAAYFIKGTTTTVPLTLVAKKGDSAFGALPAKFGTLSPPVVSGSGDTAFVSTLTGSTAGTGTMAKGLWKETGGTTYLLGRRGRGIGESGTTTMDNFKTPIFNDDTDVLFEIAMKDPAPAGIRPAINSYGTPPVGPIYMFIGSSIYPGLNGTAISRFDETVQDYDFIGATAAAVRCKTATTRVTAANDTAVARVDGAGHAPLVGPGVLAFAESQPSPIGSDVRYGQMVPRVSIMKQSIMWGAALVAGPATPPGTLQSQTSRALFRRLPGAGAEVIARAGDVASVGANYSTFLAAVESYDNQPTFKVTLTGPSVTTATNEGIYRYGLGQVWREGALLHATAHPGVKITRILKFWSLRHGQVILLAVLSGTKVTSANDVAVILMTSDASYHLLLREGDYTEGTDGAKIGTIQKVDVEPVGSQYVILASLTGSAASNQALFTGRTTDFGPSPINPRLARAGMKLRKGTAYDTGFPGLPTGVSTKITSMSITTTTDVAGAGGKGLGQAINDGGVVGLTVDYSNRIREIRKGVP